MSGSLPISKPMMLPRGSFASAVLAHSAACCGVAVTRFRSRMMRTPNRVTIWLTSDSHVGVSSNAHSGFSLVGAHTDCAAESPPIRSTSGPLGVICASTRPSRSSCLAHTGIVQYSVERPR